METLFKNLAIKLLGDENGISEDAYAALLAMAEAINGQLALDLDKVVNAADERFFIDPDNLPTLKEISDLPLGWRVSRSGIGTE